jgi:type II secretory pathway component PulF
MRGEVELIWRGVIVPASLRAIAERCYVTGDTCRGLVREENQERALEALRREGLHLISLNPVRATLEDYFMQQLTPADKAVEVTA